MKNHLLIVGISCFLSACGGGGGGDTIKIDPTPEPTVEPNPNTPLNDIFSEKTLADWHLYRDDSKPAEIRYLSKTARIASSENDENAAPLFAADVYQPSDPMWDSVTNDSNAIRVSGSLVFANTSESKSLLETEAEHSGLTLLPAKVRQASISLDRVAWEHSGALPPVAQCHSYPLDHERNSFWINKCINIKSKTGIPANATYFDNASITLASLILSDHDPVSFELNSIPNDQLTEIFVAGMALNTNNPVSNTFRLQASFELDYGAYSPGLTYIRVDWHKITGSIGESFNSKGQAISEAELNEYLRSITMNGIDGLMYQYTAGQEWTKLPATSVRDRMANAIKESLGKQLFVPVHHTFDGKLITSYLPKSNYELLATNSEPQEIGLTVRNHPKKVVVSEISLSCVAGGFGAAPVYRPDC